MKYGVASDARGAIHAMKRCRAREVEKNYPSFRPAVATAVVAAAATELEENKRSVCSRDFGSALSTVRVSLYSSCKRSNPFYRRSGSLRNR